MEKCDSCRGTGKVEIRMKRKQKDGSKIRLFDCPKCEATGKAPAWQPRRYV